MKLSELRPCDYCNEGLLQSKDGTRYAMFYLVTVDRAVLNPRATQRVMGIAQFFGLQMAEIMGPDADDAVAVASEKFPDLKKDELMVCQRCYTTVPMAVIAEKRDKFIADAEEFAERTAKENERLAKENEI